jgi:hypothetical protein
MSEDLLTEIEAVNAIFGSDTLLADSHEGVYILKLPNRSISIRLLFPPEYPSLPPQILGAESAGHTGKKGEVHDLIDLLKHLLQTNFRSGDVCIFDLLQELDVAHPPGQLQPEEDRSQNFEDSSWSQMHSLEGIGKDRTQLDSIPAWSSSEIITEKRSVFIAHCASVTSPEEAKHFLRHLLDHDKKIAKATHNITAWRIKGEGDTAYQDCDDDGETAAGGRVLHLMQLIDLWNVMVCVTRWYGGIQLGQDR